MLNVCIRNKIYILVVQLIGVTLLVSCGGGGGSTPGGNEQTDGEKDITSANTAPYATAVIF